MVQGFERSVEVEYQVPTSSRCDQDDEGVIVVDSEEDDERCTGTMYRVWLYPSIDYFYRDTG